MKKEGLKRMDSEMEEPEPYFFTFLSVRAGAAIASIMTATLMLTAMLHLPLSPNDFIEPSYKPVQYVTIYFYLLTNFAANVLIVISVGTIKIMHLRLGLYMTMICFLIWLAITAVSYIPINDLFRFVCFENNCPEIHWLYNTRWRNYGIRCPFDMTYPNGTEFEENGEKVAFKLFKSQYEGCENYSPAPMATSTLLGIVWLLFSMYEFRTIKKLEELLVWEQVKVLKAGE